MILRPQWEWVEVYPKMMSFVYPLFYSYCPKLFFAFGGKEWNLDLGTRKVPSSQSSDLLLPLLSLTLNTSLGNKNGTPQLSRNASIMLLCCRVTYAHTDKAVLFKSGFFSFPLLNEQFLEAVFSNSFMLYFCSFQLTVALYIVPLMQNIAPFFLLSPASYLHLSAVHLRSISNVNVLTSPVGQASHLKVSDSNQHTQNVCLLSLLQRLKFVLQIIQSHLYHFLPLDSCRCSSLGWFLFMTCGPK